MNKEQFLKQLAISLDKLSKNEIQEILNDYEEHFVFGLEAGKTEEEISASLGSPQQIAKEIKASYYIEKVENNKTAGNVMRAIWAAIGLGFFNLIIVLGPFIAVASLIVSAWIVGVSFTLSPLLVVISAVIQLDSFELFELFASITLCGLGIFICMGMRNVTRLSINGLVRYLNFNVSLVKGGLKNNE